MILILLFSWLLGSDHLFVLSIFFDRRFHQLYTVCYAFKKFLHIIVFILKNVFVCVQRILVIHEKLFITMKSLKFLV